MKDETEHLMPRSMILMAWLVSGAISFLALSGWFYAYWHCGGLF